MIIILKNNNEIRKIRTLLKSKDISFKHVNLFKKNIIITSSKINNDFLNSIKSIEKTFLLDTEYQLCSRKFKQQNTIIKLSKDIIFGGDKTIMMAGPCTVESKDQVFKTAEFLKRKHNIKIFRAGAFKPRTSPYAFQGLEDKGLAILKDVKKKFDLKIITEVKDTSHLKEVAKVADIIQIGTKSMFDFTLLAECGKIKKPILLKRGFMSTIKEFLQCADFIISNGNEKVILCERGIRTFEPMTRFSLDLCSAAIIKKISHLPLVLDPSHAIGIAEHVSSMSAVSAALGVDGLLIETHPNPEEAKCDKEQALSFEQFTELYNRSDKICAAIDKKLI